MRIRNIVCNAACLSLLAFIASPSSGQIYTENFDDGNAVSRWTANAGIALDVAGVIDTNFDTLPVFPNVDGINDDFSGFAFDYSGIGIPAAPSNSDPNSTIALKLQTNLFTGTLGGFSASPNSLNLTGDYSITFDAWTSSFGPFPFGGAGSTQLSTFGLLTAGTTSQSTGSGDGVWFSYTNDASSSSDYRVYSAARTFSHQCCDPNTLDPVDGQAFYHAGTRNGTGQVYLDAMGDPNDNGLQVPQSIIDANPTVDLSGPQLFSGATAFQWHQLEIRKEGDVIDWFVNGFKLITFDTTDWSDPNTPGSDPNSNGTITPGGGNISFGINSTDFTTASPFDSAVAMSFTLIDNIEVNAIVAVFDADFDDNNIVDGLDFLAWQQNSGLIGGALNGDGDANGDGNVDAADLAIWESQYGSPPPLSAISAVPEPTTLFSWIAFSLFTLLGCRPCRQTA